jgi:predicted lactoylglutathione lyase
MGHSSTSVDAASTVPSGTERARAFLPTKDFEVSKEFYAALGFSMILEGDVAIFAIGESEVILTRFWQKEYAENFMMQVLVDDLMSFV